jgi:Mn-containing catalase
VNTNELLDLLREFHREKEAMRQRHIAVARHVSHYDFNNTYQYIINREDGHVRWLYDAVVDMGGQAEDSAVPDLPSPGKAADAVMRFVTEDRDQAQAFVARWTPRLEAMPNARHKTMLRLMLGETLEHKRFFDLMLAGRDDLLGRRADGAGTGGGVLPTRWMTQ